MATTRDGYDLLHQGAIALAQVESNGICIDENYVNRAVEKVDDKISRMRQALCSSEAGVEWKRMYGRSMNLGSRVQLAELLRAFYGCDLPETKSGKPRADEPTLSELDLNFVKMYLELQSWMKARGTYLEGIRREVVDGLLRPFFNLHTVSTYRSSSDAINFQNIPVRNLKVSRLIRRCIIPRPGHKLVETDYGGIEVRIAACYNEDPALIEYIKDPSKDMHRDMAAQCYCIPNSEVTKELRYASKNQFVFPQFYGDWYWHCAQNLWESAVEGRLKTVSGVAVEEYLLRKGITKLGTEDCHRGSFAGHLRSVEEDFWGRRFRVYGEWRDNWVTEYLRNGKLQLYTGFTCRGLKKRTEIINYAIQGTAFHCLLWSLIRLVRVELRRHKIDALIVGQIHDSLLGDVRADQVPAYIDLVTRVMTVDLPKLWKWIIVPLVAETVVYGRSWAEPEKEVA